MLYAAPEPPHAWWWVLPALSALGGITGGLFGSYFSKRAEIAAIESKLDTVVKQNNRLTLDAEEIKRRVTGRQRLWELKREIAYDVMKTTGVIGHLFISMNGVYNASRESQLSHELRKKLQEDLNGAETKFKESLETLWGLEGTSHLVFDEKVVEIVRRLINSSIALMAAASSPVEADRRNSTDAFGKDRGAANFTFQKELKQE